MSSSGFTVNKKRHKRFRRCYFIDDTFIWIHKARLTPVPFIEVPVPELLSIKSIDFAFKMTNKGPKPFTEPIKNRG